MTISIDDLRKLPVHERLELVEILWDSIAADAHLLPLSDQQAEELDRRLADHGASPAAATSWDEVRDRMQKNR
jgi:putative addiction module component (TIGR02574 family)